VARYVIAATFGVDVYVAYSLPRGHVLSKACGGIRIGSGVRKHSFQLDNHPTETMLLPPLAVSYTVPQHPCPALRAISPDSEYENEFIVVWRVAEFNEASADPAGR